MQRAVLCRKLETHITVSVKYEFLIFAQIPEYTKELFIYIISQVRIKQTSDAHNHYSSHGF